MSRPVIGISMNYMKLGSYHQFHIRDKYIDALYDNGALPLLIPCMDDKACLRDYLGRVGALVIIGGLDYPPDLYGQDLHPKTELAHERRVKGDYALLETALELKVPVLGICAGMQLLNVFFGGALIQHIQELDAHFGEKYHPVKILGGRWLPQIFGRDEITVNSNHHQGVDPKRIGKGLTIVARTEDGMIEALEYETEQMVLGIQWHPERIVDPEVSRTHFMFLNRLAESAGK
ncbi:MAG TPA: gamma-glutamyl-gamma-aminobutyrate hydrolase family protein [Candidatus Syntrophosphaera sp.]|nr:gamma-glutamyl-gamma-aminobutyrate hydrolase family protein [Candidatus Syntrophosphaera sp.]